MVRKTEFIWNLIASGCAAVLSMVLLFIVTRVNGVTAAGMFSITFASATVLYSIADYGMRIYHATDTTRQHAFGVYLSSRLIVGILMIVCGILFVIVSGYTSEKAAICLGFVGFRFVDGISEAYQGEFQLQGRLDIAGKSVTFRILIPVALFAITDIYWKNMVISTCVLLVSNLALLVLYDMRLIRKYTLDNITFRYEENKVILRECFPLFFSTLLNNYIVNAPKYAIDQLLGYDMQTYFNILYLPTFTINLMGIFLLKPMLKGMGEMWNGKEYRKFGLLVGKICGAIIVFTLLVEGACATIGIPVLNFIYKVELQSYKKDLLILVLAGCFTALSVAVFYALTAMRTQKLAGAAFLVAAVCGLFLPRILVGRYGITGAAVSSVIIMVVQTLVLLGMFALGWRRKEC